MAEMCLKGVQHVRFLRAVLQKCKTEKQHHDTNDCILTLLLELLDICDNKVSNQEIVWLYMMLQDGQLELQDEYGFEDPVTVNVIGLFNIPSVSVCKFWAVSTVHELHVYMKKSLDIRVAPSSFSNVVNQFSRVCSSLTTRVACAASCQSKLHCGQVFDLIFKYVLYIPVDCHTVQLYPAIERPLASASSVVADGSNKEPLVKTDFIQTPQMRSELSELYVDLSKDMEEIVKHLEIASQLQQDAEGLISRI